MSVRRGLAALVVMATMAGCGGSGSTITARCHARTLSALRADRGAGEKWAAGFLASLPGPVSQAKRRALIASASLPPPGQPGTVAWEQECIRSSGKLLP